MNETTSINFQRIADAIVYLQDNFKKQPSLAEIAAQVHLSPFHFQRMFSDWAGVSPKKFMQYLSVEYAKQLLKGREATLFDTAQETGLSGTGRLHDLFVKIEGMTPGEFKNGGENLTIKYSFGETPFGSIIVASTRKGICCIAFISDPVEGVTGLKARFPNAVFEQAADPFHREALAVFQRGNNQLKTLKLHLKGTPFQLKVWEALLKIPSGEVSTYGSIGNKINQPKASRAIGTAIGSNPVAFLIPCHRVIQSTGNVGGYMWGPIRKSAILGWEAARANSH